MTAIKGHSVKNYCNGLRDLVNEVRAKALRLNESIRTGSFSPEHDSSVNRLLEELLA